MPNPYPCHDPHRVDAVLACMLDAVAEHPEASGPDVAVVAQSLLLAIDRRVLLRLRPLTGRDEAYGRAFAEQVLGLTSTPIGRYAAEDRAVASAIAVRLAEAAICTRVDAVTLAPIPSSTCDWLWRAAATLAGISAGTHGDGACPECGLSGTHKMQCGRRQQAQRPHASDPARTIEDFFARAGVTCEVSIDRATGTMRPRIGKPTADQMDALKRNGAGDMHGVSAAVASATSGPRAIHVRIGPFAVMLNYAVAGEDES